jgi:hypothetical protein
MSMCIYEEQRNGLCSELSAGLGRALQLAVQAKQQGLPGAEGAAMRLVTGLSAMRLVTGLSAKPYGLCHDSAVEAVAAAAGPLASEAFSRAVKQCCMVGHLQQCIKLLQAVADHKSLLQQLATPLVDRMVTAPKPANCIKLAELLTSLPQLQQRLVAAAAAALRSDITAALSCLPQAQALAGRTELHRQVVAAAAHALRNSGSGSQAAWCIPHMQALSSQPKLQRHLAVAIAEVLSSKGSIGQLNECVAVLEALRGQPHLRQRSLAVPQRSCCLSWTQSPMPPATSSW